MKLGERIGCGLCSDVYRAQTADGVVAVKVTDHDVAPHNSRNELKALVRLKGHANVVELLGHQTARGETQFVFELFQLDLEGVVGASSRKRVLFGEEDTVVRVNRLAPERCSEIAKGVASGLEFIHGAGIIHRDVKPANIMFKTLDSQPVIIDFGISWSAPDNFGQEPPDSKITDIATGRYKAPELLFSVKNYTSAVDVWALGIVMTLLYSTDCRAIFVDDADRSDLALLSCIFETFGTPSEWPEASHSAAFQAMAFVKHTAKPLAELLPRAPEEVRGIFGQMMAYESTTRVSASYIAKHL